jgi:hypothetical protein
VIVHIESHRQERADPRPEVVVLRAGARWGKPADFSFDQTDAEAENEARGGISQVQLQQNRNTVWNLSPVWRAFDVVEIESSENPDVTIEATVTRQMLIPVGSETQRYVGCGIGYVEDPGDYGFETRTIYTFVLLSLPSPVPDAPVVSSGEEGDWPTYPEEAIPPGKFTPLAAVPGPWTR